MSRSVIFSVLTIIGVAGLGLVACSKDDAGSQTPPLGTSGAGAAGAPASRAGAGVGVEAAGSPAQALAGRGSAGAAAAGAMGTAGAAAGSGAAGSAGMVVSLAGTGGAAAASGGAAIAGAGGTAGAAAGSGGSPAVGSCATWPTASGTQMVAQTIAVSGTYDGKLKRFSGTGALGGDGQDEDQGPIFDLANGATLKNVILGAPAADGVHCNGSCTLENVWWEDVGEDAATLKGSSSSQMMKISCGGARHAQDKVFQHNGPGTMVIENFQAEDFGKLYRSCGNCSSQHERHVEIRDVTVKSGGTLAGINTNYNDTARFQNITLHDAAMKTKICDRFTGNSSGAEPTKTGSGADGKYCLYADSDLHWVQ